LKALVPSGYITVRDALDRIGRELFPSEWTREEHKARTGLLSEEEWLQFKICPRRAQARQCRKSGPKLQPRRIRPAIRLPLRIGRTSATPPHVISFVLSLRRIVSKPAS
jgi:hypothetical protein